RHRQPRLLKDEIAAPTNPPVGPVVQPGMHVMHGTDVALTRRRSWVQIPAGPPQSRDREMSPDPTVDLVRATVALFITVDPIGLAPSCSTVTGNMPAPEPHKMYRVVIYTGAS